MYFPHWCTSPSKSPPTKGSTTSPQTAPPVGNQIFKHISLWGFSHIQTTTEGRAWQRVTPAAIPRVFHDTDSCLNRPWKQRELDEKQGQPTIFKFCFTAPSLLAKSYVLQLPNISTSSWRPNVQTHEPWALRNTSNSKHSMSSAFKYIYWCWRAVRWLNGSLYYFSIAAMKHSDQGDL